MKWVNLTDMLFCRIGGYLFTITKPQYRNDIVEWNCVNTLRTENRVIAEGKTLRITKAKEECKQALKQITSQRI